MESRRKLARRLFVIGALLPAVLMFVCFGVASARAQTGAPATAAVAGGAAGGGPAAAEKPVVRWDLSFAIALAIGLPCLGAGFAVAKVGAAAIGAAAEKPELFTRGLIFLALAEGIAIYGLLIAILLYIKL